MKDFIKNYFKLSILMSLIFLIFGILLFINPEGVIVTISVIIGIIGMIFGLFEIIFYFKSMSHTALISGVFSLIAGVVLVTNTNILATIIPMIIGIGMVLKGVKKLELAASFKEQNIDNWSYVLIGAILGLLCGIFFIANPIMGAVVTTQIIGLLIIIYAIISIIDNIIFNKNVKKIANIIE